MNIPDKPTRRMVLHGFFGIAALPFLSACGTVIYPERVNQKNHGGLDPSIVILDGIGLFIFIIPGLIAFAVDFGTDAIYFPEGKGAHDSEKTIFDQWKSEASKTSAIEQKTIEQFIAEQTGQIVRLDHTPLIVKELGRLDQFHTTLHQWA